MKHLFATFLFLAAAEAAAEGRLAPPAVLVELFTSQGCYSCPPAEKLLAEEIAVRDDVAALELHVDYWDNLVWGGTSWRDPFSHRDYTLRQQGYNRRIRETSSVYTPQIIVQGSAQSSGNAKDRIEEAINKSWQPQPSARFRFFDEADGARRVRVEGAIEPGARVYYAIYWRERQTAVNAGENKNKHLTNINVVTTLVQLPQGTRDLILPTFDPTEQHCALWLQRGSAGRVLSAAKCPS